MPVYNRKDMPQVNTQKLSKALSMAKSKVKVTKGMSIAGSLKPSQKELIKSKVVAISKKYNKPTDMKPLIISKDNYIVDGHHRWGAAVYGFGKDVKVPTFTLHLKRDEAIELYNDIASSLNEDITIPINVGDTVLGGKFKNKRIVVKSIGKNEKGDITINNKPLMKFRLMNESTGASIQCSNCTHSWDIIHSDDRPYFCHNCGYDAQSQKIDLVGLEDWKKTLKENVAPNHDGKSAPYGSGYDVVEDAINEIPMGDLQKIDTFADKKLNPMNIVLTDKHFFDRLNDPRNDKEISSAELIGFFKRLSKKKKDFLDFLDTYNSVVAVDDRTNINIPFMKMSNKAIAKTVMRKKDFKTTDKKLDI